MAEQWYYAHDEARKGPFSVQQMKDLASRGEILPTDTVFKEGVAKGAQANRVKNLFQAASIAPQSAAARPNLVEENFSPEAPSLLPTAEAMLQVALLPEGTPSVKEAKPDNPEALIRPPETAPAATTQPPSAYTTATRKGRAVAGKGAIIQGQDGVSVKFRKKCTVCGHEDSSWTTIPIRNGIIRSPFYCRKCRKSRDVEIQGYLH